MSVDLDELDDLISRYVFSANFDGDTREESDAIHEWVRAAVLAERKRCAETTDKHRNDLTAGGEVRLVAAYINREIMKGEYINVERQSGSKKSSNATYDEYALKYGARFKLSPPHNTNPATHHGGLFF